MIIWRIQYLANDHLEDPASCKWSSGGSGHLQIIIWWDRPLAMIIQRIWPLAHDHPEDLASCKWSSGGTGLLQMIIRHRYFGLCRKKNFFFVRRTDRFFNGIFSKSFKAAASSWVSRQVDSVIKRGLICLTCHTFCSEGKNKHSLNQYIPVAVDGKEKRIWP